jgi:hypothetical protein
MIDRNPGSPYGCALALILTLTAAAAHDLHSQTGADRGDPSPPQSRVVQPAELLGPDGAPDRATLGGFIDDVVEAQLRAFHLPGAAVVVV